MQKQYQLINCLSANGDKILVPCQPVSAGDTHWIYILQWANVPFKKVKEKIGFIIYWTLWKLWKKTNLKVLETSLKSFGNFVSTFKMSLRNVVNTWFAYLWMVCDFSVGSEWENFGVCGEHSEICCIIAVFSFSPICDIEGASTSGRRKTSEDKALA